ncbi:ACP S-malonyltransferase [Roseivirga sp. BDSF3-8]|uniref:ACP S-malonyltransferase n=1 Tax=Roseivirga sp. BDSF3-8 TaxID=3241598 RepID=UPI0035323A27
MDKKIALLFPGGGTQYAGMGKSLYEQHKEVKQLYEEAADILAYDIKKVCFEGDLKTLSAMDHAQPAIYLFGIASWLVWQNQYGIKPAFAAGHSQGEYAALAAAGVFKWQDGLRLIRKRGELLKKAGEIHDGGMMAVNKVEGHVVEESCEKVRSEGGKAFVAVYNSPLQHVVSGARSDLEKAARMLESAGAEVNILNINTPSHCPLMDDVVAEFEEALSKLNFHEPHFTIIGNVTARPLQKQEIPGLMLQHLTRPVRWQESMAFMHDTGVDWFLDMGPQAVLQNLNKYLPGQPGGFALDVEEEQNALHTSLQKLLPDAEGFMKKCLVLAVSTKNFNYDDESYQQGVVAPYRELVKIRQEVPHHYQQADKYLKALELIRNLLINKHIPADEVEARLEDLLRSTRMEEVVKNEKVPA